MLIKTEMLRPGPVSRLTCVYCLCTRACDSHVVDVYQHYPPQVTVYTVDTSSALLERLESLQTRIIEGNVRLIILDSVAALARRVRTSKYIVYTSLVNYKHN